MTTHQPGLPADPNAYPAPTGEQLTGFEIGDRELAAAGALINMSDEEWDKRQDELYPGTGEIVRARRELLTEIAEYVSPDAPAAKLFNLFKPELAEETDLETRLRAYETVCIEHFDFRKGPNGEIRERQEVAETLAAPREVVGEELWDTTFEVCEANGDVGNTELEDGAVVKAIGVLGASPAAIGNRTRYAIEQIVEHGATVGSFDFLMAEKEVEFAKKEAEAQLGLKLDAVVSVENRPDGVVTTYAPVELGGRMIPVRILTAKDAPGRGRATTYDTMRLWNNASNIKQGDRMVAVTTDLYKAFQKQNTKEVITWETGASIEFIAHSAKWAGGKRTARQLLQDSQKAAIDSRCRLYDEMVKVGMRLPEAS